MYFETSREKSYKVKLYKAAMLYTDWVNKKTLSEKEEKSIEEFLGTNYFDRTIDWFDQFMEADEKEKLYIKNMLDEGEDLDKPARIYISTIHAAKGGEEDNVILCLDMGRKIIKSIKESEEYSDEENRVWYVGITRAKNNLYKLKAKINRQGYKL